MTKCYAPKGPSTTQAPWEQGWASTLNQGTRGGPWVLAEGLLKVRVMGLRRKASYWPTCGNGFQHFINRYIRSMQTSWLAALAGFTE